MNKGRSDARFYFLWWKLPQWHDLSQGVGTATHDGSGGGQ